MAITKEVLDELLNEYKGPDDFYGPEGLDKQLSKALIERAMQAELAEQIGYEKSEAVGARLPYGTVNGSRGYFLCVAYRNPMESLAQINHSAFQA
jgi:transposase-like protein